MIHVDGYSFIAPTAVPQCNADGRLAEILQALDVSNTGTVVVLAGNKVVGTITYGDLLKYAIREGSYPESAYQVMNANPICWSLRETHHARRLVPNEAPRLVPLVDEKEVFSGGLIRSASSSDKSKDCAILISAGGRGTRLLPITANIPKPLVPIGGVPILERMIVNFRKAGFRDFYISISYLGEQIRDYFGNGEALDCEITYLEERVPLGNAGALSLLPQTVSRVLLANADLVTQADFSDFIRAHEAGGNKATMLTSEVSVRSEYGVVVSDQDGTLLSLEEKPSQTLDVNAGVYIFELDSLRELLPKGSFSAVDVIEAMTLKKMTVQTYRSSDIWLDVGRPSDLEKADKAFDLLSSLHNE